MIEENSFWKSNHRKQNQAEITMILLSLPFQNNKTCYLEPFLKFGKMEG